jgi:hypothetical protein
MLFARYLNKIKQENGVETDQDIELLHECHQASLLARREEHYEVDWHNLGSNRQRIQ